MNIPTAIVLSVGILVIGSIIIVRMVIEEL
jgi:hypothetical protein